VFCSSPLKSAYVIAFCQKCRCDPFVLLDKDRRRSRRMGTAICYRFTKKNAPRIGERGKFRNTFRAVRLARVGSHMRRVVDLVGCVEAGEPGLLRDAARVCTTLLTAETQHPRRRGESELASGVVVGFRREVGSESSRVLHVDFLVLRPQPNLRDQPALCA
jgi:hypothetical protein